MFGRSCSYCGWAGSAHGADCQVMRKHCLDPVWPIQPVFDGLHCWRTLPVSLHLYWGEDCRLMVVPARNRGTGGCPDSIQDPVAFQALSRVPCSEGRERSQNGRGRKGPLEVIWSNNPAEAEPLAQSHVQMSFEKFQGWRLVIGTCMSHRYVTSLFFLYRYLLQACVAYFVYDFPFCAFFEVHGNLSGLVPPCYCCCLPYLRTWYLVLCFSDVLMLQVADTAPVNKYQAVTRMGTCMLVMKGVK